MGASIATLLQSFQKSAATPDGFLFQTVKNLKGGKYKTTRNYEAAKVKGILMTMGDGSLGETVDPDGLDKNDKDQKTPLMIACRMGYKEIAQVLVTGGADVNRKSSTWETPLIIACRGSSGGFPELKGADRLALVALLIEHGAEIGARDLMGNNALKWACKNNFDDIVFLLLEHPKFFMMKIDIPLIFRMFDLNGRDDLSDRVQAHFDKASAVKAKALAKEAQEKVSRLQL
jgi:ankyrin repeat protein